jgi:hypothetical protein
MLRPALRDHLVAAADSTGHSPALPLLLDEARECAYIHTATRRRAADALPGASRLGGLPDLPTHVPWPTGLDADGRPAGHACFLAQFDLADIPAIHDTPLPRRGHLWIFARSFPKDGAGIATLFEPESPALAPRPEPTTTDWGHHADFFGPIRPTPLRFTRGVSLPVYRKSFVEALTADETPGSDLGNLMRAVEGEDGPSGQIGGYSHPANEDLYREIALRQLGRPDCIPADTWKSLAEYDQFITDMPTFERPPFLTPEKYQEMQDARRSERPSVEWIEQNRPRIAAEAASWQLLLSLHSNLKAHFTLGDGMALDVFLRSADLAAQNFQQSLAFCPAVL